MSLLQAVKSWRPVFLFCLCFLILCRTLVPTIYTLDSSEFITGAQTLGFVHAPGYPLYLLILHFFLKLPFADAGIMGNIFSALCLALTVPMFYLILVRLIGDANVAMSATLIFAWSYSVWLTGLFTEVYALQLLTLTGCGLTLVRLIEKNGHDISRPHCRDSIYAVHEPDERKSLLVGLLYGFAVAVHPIAILLAPGLVLTFRLLKISWKNSLLAGGLAALIFLSTLLYFPIRAAENPEFNMAGQYNWTGEFREQDLSTLDGIFWMLSGQQFDFLMFEHGYVPPLNQIGQMLVWLIRNFLGFGFLLGLTGMYFLYRQNRGVLAVCGMWFVTYFYFYATYGAQDKNMMLAPLYLLWTVVLAYGLKALVAQFTPFLRNGLLVGLPLLILVVNFPLLDLSDDTSVRDRSEALLEVLPPNALVFAEWRNAGPLEYYQVVKGRRKDLKIYNLFLFPESDLRIFVENSPVQGKTVIFIEGDYARELFGDAYRYKPIDVRWSHPDFEPMDVVEIRYNKDE